jgi:hypothetical protein
MHSENQNPSEIYADMQIEGDERERPCQQHREASDKSARASACFMELFQQEAALIGGKT